MTNGYLVDNQAIAACALWQSGFFSTKDIADLLHVREDAVYRTLHMAREGAREDARKKRSEADR